MERKLTIKQEKFCHEYIITGNASEAYRRAYNAEGMKPETVNRKAKVEIDKDKIRARLVALQESAQERTMVTVEKITAELEAVRIAAMDNSNLAAAVSAIMGKAKLHGFLVDKKQVAVGYTFEEIRKQLFGDVIGTPDLIEAHPIVHRES